MLNKLKELLGTNMIGTGMAEKAAQAPADSAYRRAVEEAKAMGETPPTRAEFDKKR